MLISMIAEAAQPNDQVKAAFLTDLLTKIRTDNRFPPANEIPNLAKIDGKAGRSPAMDQVVQGMLQDVNTQSQLDVIFSNAGFPVRRRQGTQLGREYIHRNGNEEVPAYMIRKRAADDHDGDVLSLIHI